MYVNTSETQEQLNKFPMLLPNVCQIHNFPNNGGTTEAGFLLLLQRITPVFQDFPSPGYLSLDLPSPAANSLYIRIARRQGYLKVLSPAADSPYFRIARRRKYLKVPSPLANSLYARIARRQGYLRILSPAANNLNVRIARRQGYLKVLTPAANSLYVRIARPQRYLRVLGLATGRLLLTDRPQPPNNPGTPTASAIPRKCSSIPHRAPQKCPSKGSQNTRAMRRQACKTLSPH